MSQHLQLQGTSIAISVLAVVKSIDGEFPPNFRQLFIT